MAQESKISWTHGTFNPWWGCTKVSPACEACYAERDSNRFAPGLWGKDAPRRFFGDKHWNEPIKWNAKAQREGKPFRVFCASMADVFEDRRDLDASRDRLWKLIEDTPYLTWLVLTKRADLMTTLSPARWANEWPRNVWAMTTVEDQKWADKRIPYLLKVPAIVRGLSVEPLLGPIDLWSARYPLPGGGLGSAFNWGDGVNWVIAGGESGPTARPMRPSWVRSLRDECAAAECAFHIKQWGEWGPDPYGEDGRTASQTFGSSVDGGYTMFRHGKKLTGRELDGRIWDEYPLGQRAKV